MADNIQEKEAELKEKDKKNTQRAKQIPENTMIKVKSTVFGTLVYKAKRSGDITVWDEQGDIQYMTLRDLIAMRNDAIVFFKNQWVVVVGVDESETCKASVYDIYSAIGVSMYYKNIIDPTDYQAVCGWSLAEIPEKVAQLSPAGKENFIVALNKFISDGILDSRKKIKAFEKALGCDLVEED